MKNISIKNLPKRVTTQSFVDWAKENQQLITNYLINEGLIFINEHAENLKYPLLQLALDDKWHYLDKPTKKQSYRAKLEVDSHGVPTLLLTYYTFRHGNYSVTFKNQEALKALWLHERGGRSTKPVQSKPVIKPLPSPIEDALPVQTINWVARDIEQWQSMPTFGVSHYLKRKGLGNRFIGGIRFAKNQIAVAIINTNNEFQGLQRIFNDGQKRFTKCLAKKGHFAVIGSDNLPQKLSTIHVCEGVATAASIHLATGEIVFSALDAFNLLPVCKNLKRHYPKTPIIIWADNDWQKAEKITKYGQVIGNTGLIQANRTAFKLRNARVATPDFSSFEPDDIKGATDFNDLYQLSGLDSLISVIPKQPDIALALCLELRHYQKLAHGVLSPAQFSEGLKENYNSRYLPS
ncbi:MAG: hypothetical protein H0U57_06125, partial [Tatlockia sp.]|nr:hypothetical protein [Tatlockia sp.]